jgi:hypothetical protein
LPVLAACIEALIEPDERDGTDREVDAKDACGRTKGDPGAGEEDDSQNDGGPRG